MSRLSKSGIEYLDYSWGIFSGCQNLQRGICSVSACWAKSITKRFPNHYPLGFEPTFYPEALESPLHLKRPSRIGVGWVGDVIGYGMGHHKDKIFSTMESCARHTFLLLTKNPDQLIKWSPFPDNCWVGFSATNDRQFHDGMAQFITRENGKLWIEAPIRFVSFEPLLESVKHSEFDALFSKGDVNWVIVGAQTKPYRPLEISWVREIVSATDQAGIPVFLKDNLKPMLKVRGANECIYWRDKRSATGFEPLHFELRQEMPE